jgi:pyridoxine kinase
MGQFCKFSDCHIRLYRFDIPLIRECHFVGSGDLFSALLLTWLDETQWNVRAAIRATIASMQAVLKRTAERANAGFVKEKAN